MKKHFLFFSCIIFALLSLCINLNSTNASGETFAGTSSYSITRDETITFSDLQIQGSGNDILDINIFVPYGTLEMATTTGLSFNSDTISNNLNFSGTWTNINNALRTLKFSPSLSNLEKSNVNLQITIGGLENSIYSPTTHHLYQINRDSNTWQVANDTANQTSYQGSPGYLATITTEDEQGTVNLLRRGGWLGANDYDTEGEWNWVGGPESGQTFWNGAANGNLVEGYYANWRGSMPDNYSGSNPAGEQCLEISDNSGGWNDQNCDGFQVAAYIVEYGDTEHSFDLPYKNISIEISDGRDLNLDHIEDIKQQNVRDFLTPEGKWISMVIGSNCSYSNSELVTEASLTTKDAQYNYPGNLLDFTASCGFSSATQVRIFYYDELAEDLILRKFNPTTGLYSGITELEDFQGLSDQVVGDNHFVFVSYILRDGGVFDTDGEENGQFSDPIGLAVIAPPEQPQDNQEQSSSQTESSSTNTLASTGTSAVPFIALSVISFALLAWVTLKSRI